MLFLPHPLIRLFRCAGSTGPSLPETVSAYVGGLSARVPFGIPHLALALECRIVEFKKVEKIGIESDGHKVIVLNLTGMTEPNLVDD